MADIVASFNTKSKELSVTVDGKAVANVFEASFYKSYSDEDDFRCGIGTCEKNEDDDCVTMTRLMAAASPEGKLLAKSVAEDKAFPGFLAVKNTTSRVEAEILKHFGVG